MNDARPDRPGSPDLRKDRLRAWIHLLKCSRSIETELRRRLRDQFGATLPQFDVLAALARHPEGLKMSELSAQLMVSNGNVTGIVDRLVKDGQIERRAVDGDRRASRIALSADGAERFATMAAAHAGWIDALLGALDAPGLQQLESALGRLRD